MALFAKLGHRVSDFKNQVHLGYVSCEEKD